MGFSVSKNLLARERPRPPCVKGKRSAVAVVNASPVDWQSRDRVARRQLSCEQHDWGIAQYKVPFSPKTNVNS